MTIGNLEVRCLASSDSQSHRLQYQIRHPQQTLLTEFAADLLQTNRHAMPGLCRAWLH
jgi:hypothetical protein